MHNTCTSQSTTRGARSRSVGDVARVAECQARAYSVRPSCRRRGRPKRRELCCPRPRTRPSAAPFPVRCERVDRPTSTPCGLNVQTPTVRSHTSVGRRRGNRGMGLSTRIRMRSSALVAALLMALSVLSVIPAQATPGVPPDITSTNTTTLDPDTTTFMRLNATGVDSPATVSFTGTGVTGTIVTYGATRLRLEVTVDASAAHASPVPSSRRRVAPDRTKVPGKPVTRKDTLAR